MSKREQNKTDKRIQIINAARELMKSRNTEGFSMRQLAEESGVSLATPYNLFGSKQGVISAVMDTDFDEFKERLLRQSDNPLELIFGLISITTQLFGEQPNYYKTGALAMHQETDESIKSNFGLPRQRLMTQLVQQAIQHGYISHRIDAGSLSLTLGMQLYSWIQVWANDQISLDELRNRGRYTFALTLAGASTDVSRGELTRRVIDIQATLPENQEFQSLSIKTGT